MPLDRHTKTALRRELARAEEEQKRLTVVVAYLRERLSEEAAAPTTGPTPEPKKAASEKRTASRITSAQAAEQVLRESGEWMRTPDLLRHVQKLGAKMKDSQNLYKTLDRNPNFRRHGRGLWGLAEWPNPDEPQNRFFVIGESSVG
jgi:hypothetical protein